MRHILRYGVWVSMLFIIAGGLIGCYNRLDSNHSGAKTYPIEDTSSLVGESSSIESSDDTGIDHRTSVIADALEKKEELTVNKVEPTEGEKIDRKEDKDTLEGLIIGIDSGHQRKGSNGKEAVSPNSQETKSKVSSGTRGVKTKKYEYEVNLEVGMLLKEALEQEGAKVIMSRESHDVDISNQERAALMNEVKADLVIRIHCNGSQDAKVQGMFMLVPAKGRLAAQSRKAAEILLDEAIKETGARSMGVRPRSDLTGFNWSTVPVVLIEMGHMTNAQEDVHLSQPDYQKKIIEGLKNGVIRFVATSSP